MTIPWILLVGAAFCGGYWLGGHQCLKALRTTHGRARRGHRTGTQRPWRAPASGGYSPSAASPEPQQPSAGPAGTSTPSGRGGDTQLIPRVR